jgi:predicted ATPase
MKLRGNSFSCYDDVQALIAYSQVSEIIRQRIKSYKSRMNFISSYRLAGERIYLEEDLENSKIQASGKGFVNQLLHWRESNRERYESLVSAMRSVGVLYDIEPERIDGGQFRVRVTVHKEGPLASLSDVGFGISQLLPVIVGDIELGEGSTLFTAQPEIHLHPNAQANYADYMIGQLNHGKNYVVETHSEYLLNRIRLAIVKGILKEEDVRIYYLSQEKDSTKIYPVQFTKTGQITGAPKDFFETYMIDVMNIAMEAVG